MKRYSIALAACLILPGFGQSKGDFDEMQRRLDEVERQRRVEENRARQREIRDKLLDAHEDVYIPVQPIRRKPTLRELQTEIVLMELKANARTVADYEGQLASGKPLTQNQQQWVKRAYKNAAAGHSCYRALLQRLWDVAQAHKALTAPR